MHRQKRIHSMKREKLRWFEFITLKILIIHQDIHIYPFLLKIQMLRLKLKEIERWHWYYTIRPNVFIIHLKVLSFRFGKCSYGTFQKPLLNCLSLFTFECACLILQTYAPNPCLSMRFLWNSKKSDHLQDACVWLFTDQYQQIAKKHRSKHHGIE